MSAEALPVTVTVARRVAPGREVEFEEWAESLTRAASVFPGFLGAGMLRPGHVGQDWHVVYRFDTAEHLQQWERSPARTHQLELGRHLVEGTSERRVSGLETWFELPGRTAPAPPRWKMFVVSVVGLYVLNLSFVLAVSQAVSGWPTVARVAAQSVTVTTLMTWVLMPRLARLLQNWLYAPPGGAGGGARGGTRHGARDGARDGADQQDSA